MRRLFLAAVPLVALVGCQNGGIGMAESPAWFATSTPQQQAAYFGRRCASYGIAQGTPEMVQCIASESRTGRVMAGNRAAAASQAMANSVPRTTTTNCNRYGNNVTCTSY